MLKSIGDLRCGGTGGIRKVAKLPDPPKKGSVVYVKADYNEGTEYVLADFNIQITAASIRGDYNGYARTGLAGGIRQGGSINPDVTGIQAIYAEATRHLTVLLTGALAADFGTDNQMEVRIGDASYVLNHDGGGEWRSGGRLSAQWGIGNVVNLQLYRAGTDTGITQDGRVGTIGDVDPDTITGTILEDFYYVDPVLCEWVRGLGVPVVDSLPEPRRPGAVVYVKEMYTHRDPGPYVAEDFDLPLTAGTIPGTTVTGYDADTRTGILVAPGLVAVTATFSRAEILITPEAYSALGDPVNLRGVYGTLGTFNFRSSGMSGDNHRFAATGLAGVEFVDGQEYTIRVITTDNQTGFTEEGVRTIGDAGSPGRGDSREVDEDFYHVDPVSMEWVRGLGGASGAYFFVPTSANRRYGVEIGVRGTDPSWKWRTTLVADLASTGELTLDEDLKTVTLSMAGAVTAQQLVTALMDNASGVLESAVITAGTTANETLLPRSVGDVEHFYFYREPLVAQAFNEAERGGGVPSAFLRQTDDNSLGLIIGLARADAGPGWNLNARAPGAGETIGAEVDVPNREITLHYGVASTQAQIKAALNDLAIDSETTLYVEEIHDTDMTKAAVAVATVDSDFLGFFPRGAGQTDVELRGRLNAIAKPFALRGGPVVPESEIDPNIARDSEIKDFAKTGGPPVPESEIDQNIARDSEVDAVATRIDNLTFAQIGGQIADGQVPESFTRDSEITRSFLLGIIGITQSQLDDIFIGATVTGSGAGRAITITKKDGSTIRLPVPDTGDGGGGGGADGHVSAAEFSDDGTTLTLTLSTGGTVVANIPALLRSMGAGDLTAIVPISVQSATNLSYPVPDGSRTGSGNIDAGTVMRLTDSGGNARFLVRFAGTDTRLHSILPLMAGGQFSVTSIGGAGDGNIDAGNIVEVVPRGPSFVVTVSLTIDQTVPFGSPVSVRMESPIATTGDVREAIDQQIHLLAFRYQQLAEVRRTTVNYIVLAEHDGFAIVKTGGASSRVSLPAASGQNAVRDGYSLILSNLVAADYNVAPDGSDQINGTGGITLGQNETIRVTKIDAGKWQIVADTRQATGTGTGTTSSGPPSVIEFSADTTIANDADSGDTYHFTGNTSGVTLTLPNVSNGWELVVRNDATESVEIDGPGLDAIDGETDITLLQGTAIRLQKVANRTWRTISVDPEARSQAARAESAVDALAIDVASNVSQIDTAVRTAGNAVTEAEGASAAAAAAQLDVDTVIGVGPSFIHGDATARNLSISIRHPVNAYSTATLMTVAPAGQSAVIVDYDPAQIQQDTLAEVSSAALQNIWDQTDAIDDGMGGTTNVQRYPVGSYIPVEIRLITGRGGATVFIRVVDVLVVAAPPTVKNRFETAVGASGTAGNVPAGTYDLSLYIGPANGRVFEKRVRLANVAAADRVFSVRLQGGNFSEITMRYTAATRTLTYSQSGGSSLAITAIGEA